MGTLCWADRDLALRIIRDKRRGATVAGSYGEVRRAQLNRIIAFLEEVEDGSSK